MFVKSLLKKIIKFVTYTFVVCLVILIAALQSDPVVQEQAPITPKETSLAKRNVKNMMDKLASHLTFVEFEFSNEELDAISKLGSHLLPNTRVWLTASHAGAIASTTTEVNFFGDWYINASCWLVIDSNQAELDDCYIGSIPLPSSLVEWGLFSGANLVMGEEVANTVESLLASATFKNGNLTIKAKKSKFFRDEVNRSLSNIGDLAAVYAQSSNVSPELIEIYVDRAIEVDSKYLHDYIKALATLANDRSQKNNAVDENTALIWSLAIVFGDYRFGSLMNLKRTGIKKEVPTLRGRVDLTLHFIYSAILQQLGDTDIALSIGEAKELLDSIKGGSGYSFADLSADKSGLVFANFLTSNKNNALIAQQKLKALTVEDTFFPYVHDLPEGFREQNFKRVIKSTKSKSYKALEQEIDLRIANLPIYKSTYAHHAKSVWSKPDNNKFKLWYKVDTHIHTKFSDGNNTVEEVAEQAFKFGCDAIAITDHGDHNLKQVVSDEYFSTIKQVQKLYPYMTIIPGLEWNIPPFNGREHVTVLLPDSPNIARNLSAFRERYDHFNRFDEKVLLPVEALNWLNKHGRDSTTVAPVLIYNHPSRKDFQQRENEHDLIYWRKYSDLIIGFSGAPGHQKKRGDKNGSYNKHIKTIDGWDPSVATVGGEWDRLLQKGYNIWAARSASDFHNNKMDYWPCQFSSTHVNARSSQHNDILSALRKGEFWAQHGGFVQQLDYNIRTAENRLVAGQEGVVLLNETVAVNLDIKLKDVDWQGNPATLDELELIIITKDNIRSMKFYEGLSTEHIKMSYQYKLTSDFVVFRWRGKSFQAQTHQYMFYTNPIKLTTR